MQRASPSRREIKFQIMETLNRLRQQLQLRLLLLVGKAVVCHQLQSSADSELGKEEPELRWKVLLTQQQVKVQFVLTQLPTRSGKKELLFQVRPRLSIHRRRCLPLLCRWSGRSRRGRAPETSLPKRSRSMATP